MAEYPKQIWLIESEYHDIQWSEEPNPFAVIPEDEGPKYIRADIVSETLKGQREIVAAWMIHRGYATGHGDTIEGLLQELGEQISVIDCTNNITAAPLSR